MKDQIIDSYNENKGLYNSFQDKITGLLIDLLADQKLTVHQISGRTKSLESLSKKITEKGEKYNSIDDITDVVGIRIITYLESDVDLVSELIDNEFDNDIENSVDKRKLKADQFGYKSLHIVTQLNKNRKDLNEYKKYKGIKFEIQIRSILQHAWAEIEHDLGYKGQFSIPDQYKRAFNRLSALLETADIEFDRLKLGLENYEKQVPELIESSSNEVDINGASIEYFINNNNIILEATGIIKERIKSELLYEDNYEHVIRSLNYFGFVLLGDLKKALEKDKIRYLNFVQVFVEQFVGNKTPPYATAPLLYYTHFLAAMSQDLEFNRAYFEVFFGSINWNHTEPIAKKHIEIYNQSLKI